MHVLKEEVSLVEDLVAKWGFHIGDEDSAFGELQEIPVALTILGGDPLALMMTYKIASSEASDRFSIPHEIAVLVNQKRASVTFENGYAWLSLYNLRGRSANEIRDLFEQFGTALKEQNITIGPACAFCGSLDGVELCFSEGKCTRICEPCLTARLQEHQLLEQERHRPSTLHSYALPWVVALAGVGWMVFWILVDLLMEFLGTNTIVVPGVILIIVLGGVGMLLGAPLGLVVRKSGTGRKSPLMASVIAVFFATIIGEVLYVSVAIFRFFGEFDLGLGLKFLFPFVSSYDPSWIICKIIVAIALGCGCFAATGTRESMRLKI